MLICIIQLNNWVQIEIERITKLIDYRNEFEQKKIISNAEDFHMKYGFR